MSRDRICVAWRPSNGVEPRPLVTPLAAGNPAPPAGPDAARPRSTWLRQASPPVPTAPADLAEPAPVRQAPASNPHRSRLRQDPAHPTRGFVLRRFSDAGPSRTPQPFVLAGIRKP